MSVDRKEIDLIIRAALQGGKDLASVSKSIDDITKSLEEQTAAAKKGEGSIDELKATLEQLKRVQDDLKNQAGLIGQFEKLSTQIENTSKRVERTSKAFTNFQTTVGDVSKATEEQRAKWDKLATAASNAQTTLTRQQATQAALAASLKEAGISTDNLAEAENRLRQNAAQLGVTINKTQQSINSFAADQRAAKQAARELAAEQTRAAEAQERAAKSNDFFANSGRTTLSLYQRIRGEILSMTAAYVGLYGAINGATQALAAYNTKQGIQNQLALSVGNDQKKIADEYLYIREQADRIGVSFEETAKAYAKFSASARLAGKDAQEIRFIFESFLEVSRVANLTKDELDGTLRALEQIVSKGKIQAEELRGQLGDRLFGAFQVAAQALKDQFPNLDKALKNGEVTANELVKIAEKYKELVGPQLATATEQLSANQARLNSALFDFKNLVAEQGFADEYNKLVTELTTFFQSDDGKQFAKDLSDGLSLVVQGLRWMVENMEIVKSLITTAFGLYASKLVIGFGASIVVAARNLAELNVALAASAGLAGALKKSFLLLSSFFVGWEIGTILSAKFKEVRLAGVALVIGLNELWTKMKYTAQIIWAELPNIVLDSLSATGNLATKALREILKAFSAAAKALGANDLAAAIDKGLKAIEFRTDRIGSASGQLRKQMEADLKRIREIGDEMADEALNPGSTSPAKTKAKATDRPKQGPAVKQDEEDAEKRLKIREQLENELTGIEAKIEKNEKDSLARRLQAIDLTYQKLLTKIRKFGGAEGAAMEARLTRDISTLKQQEARKFNEALLTEQEQIQRKLEVLDAQAGRKQKTDLDARLEAVKTQYEQTYRDIADYRQKLLENERGTDTADLMKDRLDAGVAALQNLERMKYYEDAVNAILEERKAKLDVIVAQEKAGLITSVQARENAAKVVNETQPKLEALTAEGLKYAEAMRQSAIETGASTVALDTLVAKLIEARESAKGLRTEFLSAQQVNEMLANGATTAFESVANAIGDAINGMKTWQDVLGAAGAAFRKFAADFLMQIAKMILQQALLNALRSSGMASGGIGGAIAGALSSLVKHNGGVVGKVGSRTRMVSPTLFAGAPKYHGGGIAGLAPDEYPAILKKNEEVLTTNDPRNVMNGGGVSTGGGQSGGGVKIINMIDSGSVVSEGLATAPGEKAVLNVIRANRAALKQVLA